MRIIPAIDLLNGRCVRLSQGDYATAQIYRSNPVDMALEMEANGMRYLHLVDLDGARQGRLVNLSILETIARRTNLIIDAGGGIQSAEDIQSMLDAGARQVNVGSLAVSRPNDFAKWLEQFGPEKIILSADSKNGRIMTHGWTRDSGYDLTAHLLRFAPYGLRYAACTDIARDGMLSGPSIELYRELKAATGMQIIASGGISSLHDLQALQQAGCEGAIVGKAIYENKITWNELQTLC